MFNTLKNNETLCSRRAARLCAHFGVLVAPQPLLAAQILLGRVKIDMIRLVRGFALRIQNKLETVSRCLVVPRPHRKLVQSYGRRDADVETGGPAAVLRNINKNIIK